MPIRITNISVTVYRNGKREALLPNTKFDFTKEEVDQITGAHRDALRKPEEGQDNILDLTAAQVPKNAIRQGGGQMGGEDNNAVDTVEDKEVVDPKDKPMTAAEKKKQQKAQDAKTLADEQNAGSEDEAL